MPKLSIVILTRSADAFTSECLRSLDPVVTAGKDVEVVLVDNGSAEEIEPVIHSEFPDWGDKLKIVRLSRNHGVAGGRNRGISEASATDYVMILDNDTVVPPGTVRQLVDYMDSNPGVGIAAPALTSSDGKIQKSFKKFPGVGEKIKNFLGASQIVSPAEVSDVIYPEYVIGACQIIRRGVFEQIGMLDDKIFFGPEDADFCMRTRKAGYKVAYLPQVSVVHHWQRNSSKSPFSAISLAHIRGLVYFYAKWRRLL